MNRPIPIVLIVLLLYIAAPPLLDWVTEPSGAWYKPFGFWLLVIVIAFVVQARTRDHDA